jgi:translation initiation factor 2-alpha kinase 4
VYAIKKIQLKKKFRAKIIREVVTLSRLYHKNVIRYYQSWIEIVHPELSDASASPSNTAITSTSSSGKLLSHNPTVTGTCSNIFTNMSDVDAALQEIASMMTLIPCEEMTTGCKKAFHLTT